MERWSSQFGFLLAAVSAAVGLGNVWRFSAVVGQNGGGAYLVPYLLAVFAFAVPLLALELAAGRAFRADVVSAFAAVRPSLAGAGWVVVAAVGAVLSYYLVLTGWVLAFAVAAAGGVDLTFAAFTASYWPLAGFALVTLAAVGVVSLGVREGIERLAKLVMPIVVVVLLGLALYNTTLSGFEAGVRFFLEPDLSVLGDPLLWSAAFGQVFFSLSVGQGIMLTYGSYLDADTDVVRSSLYIAVADVGVAVLAGLVIFPVVFSAGLEPTLGVELAFSTLPAAFEAMPAGRLVAVGFFAALFLAALTSSVAMLEVCVAAADREREGGRGRTAALVGGVLAVPGLLAALSYTPLDLRVAGVRVLDGLDETVGTLGLPVTAVLIAVAFTWALPRERARELVPGWVRLVVAYAVPVVLVGVTGYRLLAGARLWRFAGRGGVTPAAVSLVFLAVVAVAAGARRRRA